MGNRADKLQAFSLLTRAHIDLRGPPLRGDRWGPQVTPAPRHGDNLLCNHGAWSHNRGSAVERPKGARTQLGTGVDAIACVKLNGMCSLLLNASTPWQRKTGVRIELVDEWTVCLGFTGNRPHGGLCIY